MPESDTVESLQRILAGFNKVFKETQEANLRQILAALPTGREVIQQSHLTFVATK